MINKFFLVGDIKRISISEGKSAGKQASAIILLQYGNPREESGGAVEFVNAAMIRIPSYRFPALRDKLREGQKVVVEGHIQGVFKKMLETGHFAVELVADRVTVESDGEAPETVAAE